MKVRSLAFRTDLLIRRLAGSVVLDRPSHQVVRTPTNPFFWWGNFVLVAPDALPDAPCLFTAEFPEASHLAIGVDGAEGWTVPLVGWGRFEISAVTDMVLTASSLQAPVRPGRADLRADRRRRLGAGGTVAARMRRVGAVGGEYRVRGGETR